MKIVFMGTPQFSVVSLRKLIQAKQNILAVVTAPDKKKGRGLKLAASPVKEEAIKNNMPVLQPEKLKDEAFLNRLKDFSPDLIVVVAFKILPEAVFSLPPLGTINLHGSLLPKYRGAAPINWAIINGETETGVTTIFIKKKVDTGNIIDSRKIHIPDNMTAGELHDEMALIGADLLLDTCNKINEGKVKPKIQDESLATPAPKIFKENCKIDFNLPAKKVHDFIRGLSPYPGPYVFLNNKQLKLFNSSIIDIDKENIKKPGTIIGIKNKRLIIQCMNSAISIAELQIEGKRRMEIEEYLRGQSIQENAVLS